MKKTLLGAMEVTERLLNDVVFMCESRVKSTYFTRDNKLTFKKTILFSFNFIKRSIQLELDSFFNILDPSIESISKQGYSQARQKIAPTAFKRLTDEVVKWFYDDNSFRTYRGYRLCAIDGSLFELPNTESLREDFGYTSNQRKIKIARARVSTILDVENDIILTSKIKHYRTSERDAAKEMIEELEELGFRNDLLLFDRGYPSRDFIAFLEEKGLKYLMRAQRGGMTEVREALETDQAIGLRLRGGIFPARVLRVTLSSGNEEILITNLMEDTLDVEDFKELYFKRWDIEEKYKELKNNLQIENFTGISKLSIEQDFYATIYLANMVALVRNEANIIIHENDKDKNLKYKYQANINILVGKMKESMILIMLEDDPIVRKVLFQRLLHSIKKNKTPIRQGRAYSRNNNIKSNKFSPSQKRCL